VVVQTAFIGDVVFTSPLVHAIKEAYPQASVSLVVKPSNREVARCIPGVDQVLTFDKRASESGPVGLVRVALGIRRRKFDLLIASHRSSRTALLSWLSGVPMRVGYRKGFGRMAYHIAVNYNPGEPCTLAQDFKLLQNVGIQSSDLRLRLKGPNDREGYVKKFYERNGLSAETKLVGLCVGAYWPTKRWAPVYFASLGEALKDRGYQPVLLGGPDELSIGAEISSACQQPLLSCIGNSLAESIVLMEKCAMTVGGDSGLTHMSRALGVPTVLIYGPTDQRAHTFGEKTKVLTAKVKCRPCSRHGPRKCPELHHDCMRLVSPESVIEALREIASLQTPIPREEKKEGLEQASPGPPPT
jgi:heptosyltransferase-2